MNIYFLFKGTVRVFSVNIYFLFKGTVRVFSVNKYFFLFKGTVRVFSIDPSSMQTWQMPDSQQYSLKFDQV